MDARRLEVILKPKSDIVEFLKEELQEMYEEGKKETKQQLIKEIEEIIKKEKVSDDDWRNFSNDFGSGPRIHNSALNKILTKLNKIK